MSPLLASKPATPAQARTDGRIARCVRASTLVPALVTLARFRGSSGLEELHFSIEPTEYADFATQLDWLARAAEEVYALFAVDPQTVLWRRFFCSDLANQSPLLAANSFSARNNPMNPCAVSWVGQAPTPPAKVAMWGMHLCEANVGRQKMLQGQTLVLRRGGVAHHWTTGLASPAGATPHEQTRGVFGRYMTHLGTHGMTLAGNAIRTWLFVQNIDANYRGLVEARRALFAEHGLTRDTHYIASTGIGGAQADPLACVGLDAYSVSGICAGQVRYLSAPEYLNPTHEYGVTFERGTSVAWRDRKHLLISGTASIDAHGNILHPGAVLRQLDRTVENIGALLAAGGATLQDLTACTVYLRDPADHLRVREALRELIPTTPMVVVSAPVCRPGWLVEIEAMATVRASYPQFAPL